MNNQDFSVPQIKEGTVIDHIPHGQSLRILEILNIRPEQHAVTVGINLNSKKIGVKDIIKIYKENLDEEKIHDIAVFAPTATISFIKDFEIIQKIQATLPTVVKRLLVCPNQHCISRYEPIDSNFSVSRYKNNVYLQCHFCEKSYEQREMKEYNQ